MVKMDLYQFLATQKIPYQRFEHPAVYTCQEANQLIPELPGVKTKNLLLRNKGGDLHFLVVTSDQKVVDLSLLGKELGTSKLSLASQERLKSLLNLEPGAVSLLAIINDAAQNVQVVIDSELYSSGALQCHPLVNTSTLVIPLSGIKKFLNKTAHTATVIAIPARQPK